MICKQCGNERKLKVIKPETGDYCRHCAQQNRRFFAIKERLSLQIKRTASVISNLQLVVERTPTEISFTITRPLIDLERQVATLANLVQVEILELADRERSIKRAKEILRVAS